MECNAVVIEKKTFKTTNKGCKVFFSYDDVISVYSIDNANELLYDFHIQDIAQVEYVKGQEGVSLEILIKKKGILFYTKTKLNLVFGSERDCEIFVNHYNDAVEYYKGK